MNNSGKYPDLENTIRDGLLNLQLGSYGNYIDKYLAYIDLLVHWNKAYNLTAIKNPEDIVAYHLMDSLSIVPYIHGNQCLDLGSGAGLPGLILAISNPEQQWLLVDSTQKKTRFLKQVILELDIGNAQVKHSRIEALASETGFSTITARAVGSLKQIYQQCNHVLSESGKLLLMKSEGIDAELKELTDMDISAEVTRLKVPGLTVGRILVKICKLPQQY